MDEGAVASWPEGYDPKKYDSAIEKYHAEWADKQENGLEYVACELQNDPSLLDTGDIEQLTREMVLDRLNTYKRGRIVSECAVLSGFIDVHHAVNDGHLYWGVAGITQDFTPFVVDYGRFPRDKTVGETYQGSIEEKVLRSLNDLEVKLMAARWTRDDGVEMTPYFGVDSGSGQHQQTVFQFCRGAKGRNFYPTKGENVKDRDYNTIGKNAKRRGDHWRESVAPTGELKIPVYMFDANYWKTFLYNRLMAEPGTTGALSLFGNKRETHAELSRHVTSERRLVVQVKNAGHEYDQWDLIPGRANHLWDVLTGSMMIAATRGCALPGHKMIGRRRRRKKRKATI
jgi:phage terminase large subunit GpA-like protein